MFKNNVRFFKFDFAERADNELFDKILNFFIDSTLNNDWKNEINQKNEQNDDTILNSTQFYHTTQLHTTHLSSINVLFDRKDMNIVNEKENNEQFEKIFKIQKTQIENKNQVENENEVKNENKNENENDNENFEKVFTNISKLDKNKNRTKKTNFETKNEQFATKAKFEQKTKTEFEQESETKFEQKSKTEQTDPFTIKSIKKVILKDLNVKQKKFFKIQTKFEIQTKIEKRLVPSKNEQFINISMNDDIIQMKQIIKLFYFYAKFMLIDEANVIDFTSFLMFFSMFIIDKKIVKIFVKWTKNSKLNKIFKKSEKYKMFAKKTCYLRIYDKKKTFDFNENFEI